MRKIIAVVLAVLMLASVLAMLPASAAAYDGTTATTEGLHELIITEIAQKSHEKDGVVEGSSPATTAKRSTGYVELFNNSANTISLSSYSLLRALYYTSEPDEEAINAATWSDWAEYKKFQSKMDILEGYILPYEKAVDYVDAGVFTDSDDSDTVVDDSIYKKLENDATDLQVEAGKTGIIWFITAETVQWLKEKRSANVNMDPRTEFVKRYYGNNANVNDYKIVMVWAYASEVDGELAEDMFAWDLIAYDEDKLNYVIAVATNNFNIRTEAAYTEALGRNEKIKSMVLVGPVVKDYAAAVDNNSAYFVPATTKPEFLNAKNEFAAVTGKDPETFNNYVDAGLAESFAEVSAVIWATAPTPGKIDNWQYAMMASVLASKPAEVDAPEKCAALIEAFVKANGIGDDTLDTRDEPDVDYNFVSRDELMDRFFNNKEEEEEGGFKWWIIVVIAGGVLVLAAAAVVVFVVILPKKKAAAEAAVEAPELDEDAPVEEASEEAPAEETTEEPTEE